MWIWIILWSFIAVNQLEISFVLLNAESKNSSWPPPGYVIAEKGSNKVMVKE